MSVPGAMHGTLGYKMPDKFGKSLVGQKIAILSPAEIEAAKALGMSPTQYAVWRDLVAEQEAAEPNFSLEELNAAEDLIAELSKDPK